MIKSVYFRLLTEKSMNTIGLLGGMSAASTTEYYELVNKKVNTILGGHALPEMIICSVNFATIERCIREEKWEEAAEYLVEKARRLEAAGVDYIFLGTNTMHRVREEIKKAITVPFIDIFETVSTAIRSKGMSKVGMLGTYPVMTDAFYFEAYKQCEVDLVVPNEKDKIEINRVIFEELTHNTLLPASKAYYLDVIASLVDQGAEGVILGCTEIKLLIGQQDIPQVPLFDTLELHCDKAAAMSTEQR